MPSQKQTNMLAALSLMILITQQRHLIMKHPKTGLPRTSGTISNWLSPEVLGNTEKKKALIKLIGKDLSTGITKIDLEKENLYKLPKYYAKDKVVTDALAKANKYAGGTITLILITQQRHLIMKHARLLTTFSNLVSS